MIRFDNHAFKGLDDALKQLFGLLRSMGDGIEQLVGLMPAALEGSDPESFPRAKEIDKTINDAELQADEIVADIINKFTIMGEDLRFTLAAIKIAGTLERTADKVKNCIKRLSRIKHPIEPSVKKELAAAMEALRQMIPHSLNQLIDYTPEVTKELLQHGAAVQQAYRAILLQLHAKTSADDMTHILLVAKNLEQASDMAVEIMKISHYVHFATKYDKHAGV